MMIHDEENVSRVIGILEDFRKNKNKAPVDRTELLLTLRGFFADEENKILAKCMEVYPSFYISPASCKYHGAYEGGLFDHSIAVFEAALKLAKIHEVNYVDPVACILHDLCKVGSYGVDTIKSTPEKPVFKYCENLGLQHGSESLRRILGLGYPLTGENWQFAVAYHMGAFNANTEDTINFGKMCERYNEVLLLHNADMVASKIYGI